MSHGYAFCEIASAAPGTPWHIRRLTHVGKKLAGGVDTVALCNTKVARDLGAEITFHHLQHCCPTCSRSYADETSR